MAPKSIIPSVELGEKSPFNKKLVVLLVIVACVAIGAAAMLGRSASSQPEEEKKPEEVPYTEGTGRDIKTEFETFIPKPIDKLPTATEDRDQNRVDPKTAPLPSGPASNFGGAGSSVNNAAPDLHAQASISALSVAYEDAGIGIWPT